MFIYWIVGLCILFLGAMAQHNDVVYPNLLSTQRVRHTKKARNYYIIGACILIIIAGCRYNVGADFGAYYTGYTNYLDFWSALKALEEPGIRLIYSIAVKIHDSGGMCIFLIAAVTLGLQLIILYQNTDRIGLALILFFLICWTACFNGVRQALAAAVLFCGFPFLRDKKYFKFAVIVVLAFLCHRSAAVMILMIFIAHQNVDIKHVLLWTVAAFVVLYSYDKVYQLTGLVMDMESTSDLDSYWTSSVNILRVLAGVAPAAFFLFVCRDMKKTEALNFYLNLLILSAIVSITTAFSTCFARMSMYTSAFEVIAIAELTKRLNEHRNEICILIVVLYWIMMFYECTKSGSLNPFQLKWIW